MAWQQMRRSLACSPPREGGAGAKPQEPVQGRPNRRPHLHVRGLYYFVYLCLFLLYEGGIFLYFLNYEGGFQGIPHRPNRCDDGRKSAARKLDKAAVRYHKEQLVHFTVLYTVTSRKF